MKAMRALPFAVCLIVATVPKFAHAAEVVLKAVSAFQEGTYFSRNFESFVKKVNEEGKGIVRIEYIGGPKAIPTMEQGAALRNGVIDLANTTATFTASIVPEGLALNYATLPFSEIRKNGSLDYLNSIMRQKGLYYFARTGDRIPYHIYLNKKIDKPDLSGLKIRITPIFRDFFVKLGAGVVQMAPGEVYTGLERGVVDGYGWPAIGIFDLGWQERTKYRLEPGFYTLELGIQFSARRWDSLTPEQRDFLQKQVAWLEKMSLDASLRDAAADIKRQSEAGIQPIRLSDADSAAFLAKSQEAGWATVLSASPRHGAKLRQMMAP
ncbi:TRAP transporter substrate-binding protein DctP [Pigmentiphaga sp. D-2]|uniref:TRAP transporter substrate-binding protein DctP n=1 Tax=Pigmentiphaga sp. D-2 TaxID=1002116 RepID=UPI001404E89D|nr:TRAP transporter substrate-binding protein DctP [Pigmentiphaga sp. D-2]